MVKNIVLVFILIIAIALRFIGIYPGYPPYHTDEGITYSQGLAMILERSLDPKHGYGYSYNYPIVVPVINAIFYLFFFIPGSFLLFLIHVLFNINTTSDTLWTFDKYIFGDRNSNVIFWGRYTTASFGVLVVFITYLLGKRLFLNTWVGLIAALFVAVNYRQVLNSHIGLPDIYNTFFLMLSLLLITKLWEKQTRNRFILVGVGIALYFSTKFQLFALPPLGIVMSYILLKKLSKDRLLFLKNKNLWLMVIIALFFSLVLNTFHIIHYRETLEQVGYSALKYRYGRATLDFYPISYLYHIGIGPWMSILSIFGIILLTIFNFRVSIFLLSVVLSFGWYIAYYTGGGFYTRNLLTITPLILMFSAHTVYSILVYIKRISYEFALVIGIFIMYILISESLKNTLIIPGEYSKVWNHKLAQDWVDKNIPAGSKVAAYSSPIFNLSKYKFYEIKDPQEYFLQNLQDQGVEWAIINTNWINNSSYWWMMLQDKNNFLQFWKRPDSVLINSPIAKMMQELRDHTAYEALKPWQSPEFNIIVVKIPQKQITNRGKIVYHNNFNTLEGWIQENDGFGDLSNFLWDDSVGDKENGSLKIAKRNGAFFSQRFISSLILVQKPEFYKISGMIKTSKVEKLPAACFIGVDFLSESKEILSTSLSSYETKEDQWVEKLIISHSPQNTLYMQIYFQTSTYDIFDCWLDNVVVQELDSLPRNRANTFNSKFDIREHLLQYSNAGM